MRTDKSRDIPEKAAISATAEKRSTHRVLSEQHAHAQTLQTRSARATQRVATASGTAPKPASSQDVDAFESMLQGSVARAPKVTNRKSRPKIDEEREETESGTPGVKDQLARVDLPAPTLLDSAPAPASARADPVDFEMLNRVGSAGVSAPTLVPNHATASDRADRLQMQAVLQGLEDRGAQDTRMAPELATLGDLTHTDSTASQTGENNQSDGLMAALLMPMKERAAAGHHEHDSQSGLAGGHGAQSPGTVNTPVAQVPDSFELTLNSAVLGEVQLRAIRIPLGWRVQLRMSEFEKSQWLRDRHSFVQRGLSRSLGTDVELEILD